MDECIECGAVCFNGELYCEDCDYTPAEDMTECALCGREFDATQEGEDDTCEPCLEEAEDEVDTLAMMR